MARSFGDTTRQTSWTMSGPFSESYARSRHRHGHDLVRSRLVPVKLYTAAESSANVSFNMLHKKCGARLKQQYICPKDNEVVDARPIRSRATSSRRTSTSCSRPKSSRRSRRRPPSTIELVEFVPLAKVDRVYVEKSYYLGPDKGGDRAYRLLAEAMNETGRVALAQYAARGKQYLVLLRPLNGVLVMQQLHYADEVGPSTEVPVPEAEVKPEELALAKQLIEQIGERRRSSRRSTRTRCANGCSRPSRRRSRARRSPPSARGARRQDHRPHGGAETESQRVQGGAQVRRRRGAQASQEPQGQVVMRLHAGTSGFAFKEWKGPFYPG